jgi:FAD/FMN-containing dehydrogenase
MMKCDTNHKFENWAETLEFRPKQFCQPETEQDIIDLIRAAYESCNTCVRPQGAERSHTWSQFVLTKDVLVNLDRLRPALAVEPNQQVRVHAGIRLSELTKQLRNLTPALGMMNLGTIQEQSIAGAISTGTHGTGLRLGNLSSQIVAVKLVTGAGEVKTFTATDADPDYFSAARVNLGALGIITEVTLQCVDDYRVERTYYLCKFNDVVRNIDAFNARNTRVRLWWFVPAAFAPYDILVTTMNAPGAGGIDAGATIDLPDFAKPLPMKTSKLNEFLRPIAGRALHGCIKLSRITGHYTDILNVPLSFIPRHRECEYAIPVENTAEALGAIRTFIEEGDFSLDLPLEVRFVANDNILLSPAYHDGGAAGPGVCYIGAYTKADNDEPSANEIFQRFEPLMKDFGGRPHWGKHFTLSRSEVRALYPRFDRFNAIRRELDPHDVFANSLIHRLFD